MGYLISHHPEMQNLESHVGGLEINKFWTLAHPNKPFNGMKVGISTLFLHLGKPNILGNVFSFIPFAEAKLGKAKELPFILRIGGGVGFITKPFSFPNNIYNKAVGTHLNGSMQLMLSKGIALSENYKLNIGAGLTHFSNGNFKKPNLGINMPHFNIGLIYIPKRGITKTKSIASDDAPSHQLLLTAAIAKREIAIDDPKRIIIPAFSIDYLKGLNKQGHFLRAGADFFFDPSYAYKKFVNADTTNYSLPNILEQGIRVGYLWKVNKLGFFSDVGLYTYRPQKTKRLYYFTIGLQYNLHPKVIIFTKLKTHLSVADYFQWGISYQIYERD